jgi:hypothetical protein
LLLLAVVVVVMSAVAGEAQAVYYLEQPYL